MDEKCHGNLRFLPFEAQEIFKYRYFVMEDKFDSRTHIAYNNFYYFDKIIGEKKH